MPVDVALPTLSLAALGDVTEFKAGTLIPSPVASGLVSGGVVSVSLPTLSILAGSSGTPTFVDSLTLLFSGRLCPPQYIVPLTGQRPIGVRVAPDGTP